MPHYTYSRGARRKKLFTRISSTFINKPNSNSSILESGKMLHSKSTYFYRWGSSHKLSSKLNYVVPSVCGLALLVGGIVAINPLINTTEIARANDDFWPSTGDTTSNITLTLDPAGGAADQVTNVTNVGQVTYRSNTFSVSQSTSNWYAVLVRAANGYTSDLVNKQNTSAKITGVGKNVNEANFKENTWGYALTTNTTAANSSLLYNTVPESSDSTAAYSETSTGKSFKVVFGAKFGPDAPSGNYQTKVYLSAVSNPAYVATGFETIEDMQEMNSTVCGKAKIGDTKQLRDQRDDKMYWVAKLLDGNCWMTQNLDYDGGGTKQQDLTKWNGTDVTNATATYYDPDDGLSNGQKYYYNGPNNNHAQGTGCTNTTGLTNCNQFSTTGTDDHYLVGNYYSWNAATAGSGGLITSGEASSSICPEGWKLPTSNNSNKGSFTYLLTQYGVQSSLTNSDYAIYKAPLYFVYGGFLDSGQLYNAGYYGHYWSSTPSSNGASAYNLFFYSGVSPSGASERYHGLSVRCVAEY